MLFDVYLFCLIVGGGLVVLSLMSGVGETDADAELGGDLDADIGGDLGADVGVGDLDAGGGELDFGELPFEFDLDGADLEAEVDSTGGQMDYEVSTQRRFNPLTSLKFWTFSAAFFGLTGTLFEGLGVLESQLVVLGLSTAMGLATGVAMAYLIHTADRGADGGLTERDYLGASAEVRVPVREETTGEIRLHLEGRLIDMRADLVEGERALERGDECFVIGLDGERARVVSADLVAEQLAGEGGGEGTVLETDEQREFDEQLERERKQQTEHATS